MALLVDGLAASMCWACWAIRRREIIGIGISANFRKGERIPLFTDDNGRRKADIVGTSAQLRSIIWVHQKQQCSIRRTEVDGQTHKKQH